MKRGSKVHCLPFLILGTIFLIPQGIAWAAEDLQFYLVAITNFINETLIPFFFAVAILFLMVNITRYFIIDSSDVNGREQAKKYVMYAVIGLVFLTSIYGVINLVTSSLKIRNETFICPDYNRNCNGEYGP